MLVSFDASFDTSAIGEADVDLEDDSVDLTTASDCTGAEQASVSVAADVMTITICSGDGGAIAATSVVTIEIGTHATSSGTGSNQIANPSSAGTYQVYVSGTFGDTGSAWIPIRSTGGTTVSLTVGEDSGSGGPIVITGDDTGPVISNVQVINITETSATVTWDTDETADSAVDYGLTVSYEIGTESSTSLVTDHSIDLIGLSPATLYHFQVRSADLDANETTASGYSFTTLDDTPPVISNIQVVDITETSARITWETDEPATSVVNYGLDATYGTELSDSALVTEHSIIVTGLDPGTLYHFKVGSADDSGNYAESGDETFTTLSDEPPANIINLIVTPGDSQNYLEWANPVDDDLAGIWIVYRTDGYPTDPNDGTFLFDGLAEEYLHSGLTNGVTYYYALFAYDTANQFSSGALGSGTPFGEEEEEEEPEEEEEEDDDEDEAPPDGGDEAEPEEEVAPPEDGGVGALPREEVEFFVANNRIELIPASGVVAMLVGTELRVQLLTRYLTREVDHVELLFGDNLYLMNPPMQGDFAQGDLFIAAIGDEAYYADVFTPTVAGDYPLEVTVFYPEGDSETLEFTADVQGYGYAYTVVEAGTTRVEGSQVLLFSNETGSFMAWDSTLYGELNPTMTPADGTFAWYVPIGEYYVVASKAGYASSETAVIYADQNIINPTIRMDLLPPPLEEITEVIEEEGIIGGLPEAASMIAENISFALDQIRDIPLVIDVAEISIPLLFVFAFGNLILLALLFNLLPFLQYLFTAPILFFWRRKRKGWGVVYNSMTKLPVDLAIVRLYRLGSENNGQGKLMQSRVTDKQGRYFFLVDVGKYRIEVTKPGFKFPTEYVKDRKNDGQYLDLYHGEVIEVTKDEATITANIPIDPEKTEQTQAPSKIKLRRLLRVAQHSFAVLGVLLAVIIAIIIPSILTITVAVVQLAVYVLIRTLAEPRKPKGWGIVYDKRTNKPLGGVVVRIFEPKYNKLLETAITDERGRYSFLVGPNIYFTRYEREGYQPFEYRPIDYAKNKAAKEVTINVKMDPLNGKLETKSNPYEGGTKQK